MVSKESSQENKRAKKTQKMTSNLLLQAFQEYKERVDKSSGEGKESIEKNETLQTNLVIETACIV